MGIIRRQGIKNTITVYLGIIIGFVSLIIIQTKLLTQEELGLTRLILSFSMLVTMFVPLGINNATIRYFPLFKDKETKNHGFFAFMNLFPLVGFLLAFLVLWVFRDFILNQYRRESPLFLEYFDYVFPLIFCTSFVNVLTSYCNINYKSTIPAFLNDVVVRLLTIVVVAVYFLRWVDLEGFIRLFVGIYVIQFFILVFYVYHFDKFSLRIDWKIFREKKFLNLLRYGLLLWFAGVASIGLKYFDSIMIGKFMPLAFVGIYTVAAFIPTVIEAPLNAFEKIAAAKISFAWAENDRQSIYGIYHKSSLYMFLLGGFLFLNINGNIHTLLSFLPEGYQLGEVVVLIISIGTLFNMATGLNVPILFQSEKYRYGAFFLILLSILILSLQMLLIPIYGLAGAAMATSAASMIYNTMVYITVYRFYKLQPFDRKNLRVLMIVLVLFGAMQFLPHSANGIWDIAWRTVVMSTLYFFFIYFFRIVPEFHKYLPWTDRRIS